MVDAILRLLGLDTSVRHSSCEYADAHEHLERLQRSWRATAIAVVAAITVLSCTIGAVLATVGHNLGTP